MASLDEDIEATETTVLRTAPWLRLTHLPDRLRSANYAPEAFRAELKEAHAELAERFRSDESVEVLVHARAELIDAILRDVVRSSAEVCGWALGSRVTEGGADPLPTSNLDSRAGRAARRDASWGTRGHVPFDTN